MGRREIPRCACCRRQARNDGSATCVGSIERGRVRVLPRSFHCVAAFLLHPSPKPIRVEVGWTLNDYQIDVATPEGRAEYKKIIDLSSELGMQSLV